MRILRTCPCPSALSAFGLFQLCPRTGPLFTFFLRGDGVFRSISESVHVHVNPCAHESRKFSSFGNLRRIGQGLSSSCTFAPCCLGCIAWIVGWCFVQPTNARARDLIQWSGGPSWSRKLACSHKLSENSVRHFLSIQFNADLLFED